ncbi:MAG: hypothetical protein H0U54_03660 [Acidobacteria bacterium]|nr:hypothetical protein [Acidobacteriota bacterium]
MNRRRLSIMVGTLMLCAMALAASGEAQRKHKPGIKPSSKTLTVAFCDLIRHPELYNKKVVRTEAISAIGIESQVLYDPQCSTEETRTWVIHDPAWEKADKKLQAAYFALLFDKNNNRIPRGRSGRARVVLKGRLEASNKDGYGHLNQYRFQFAIMGIEKVERVPEDVPYWP